jgi:predicted dehydrogenase
MLQRITRRRFLQDGAALATAVSVASPLAARSRRTSANEKLNVAVIGVGGQGMYNLGQVASQHDLVNITVLCDVDSERKDVVDARKVHPRAKFHKDFRRTLDEKNIDAVVVATPDHWHAIPAVQAMRAGKHVYCEKPLAHSVHEIRVMRETAANGKLVTQMGTQIHAENNYRRVVEIAQAGVIGDIRRVHVWCAKRPDARHLSKTPVKIPGGLDYDLWLGPAPQRDYDPAFLPFHWRWWWSFGGGILADMACHYMDLPHWALNLRTPSTVEAKGKKIGPGDHDVPEVLQADYHYPARGNLPAVHLTWYSGVTGPSLDTREAYHGFRDGVLFEGDKGKLLADYGRYKLFPEKEFKDFTPPKQTIPASVGHHREWLEAIKKGGTTTCNFDYSGALAETVLLGNVAFRSGTKFTWDEEAGKTDSAEANKWLRREYRKGWEL